MSSDSLPDPLKFEEAYERLIDGGKVYGEEQMRAALPATTVSISPLRQAISAAERSFSGMSLGHDKHPSPYSEGYVKGWGNCLRIFQKAHEARADSAVPSSHVSDQSAASDRGSGECVRAPDGATEALPFTDDPVEVARRIDALMQASVDAHIAKGKMPRMVWEAQASLTNACTQVYFRAGLLACREYMARFVEAESPTIAASIRANWWPHLGEDPGAPRLLNWSEVADGGEEGPWTAKTISPQLEALPTALQFLESPHAAVHHEAPEPNLPKAEGESILREALARLPDELIDREISALTEDGEELTTSDLRAFARRIEEAARSALAGMKDSTNASVDPTERSG